jgi:hypothetical protein
MAKLNLSSFGLNQATKMRTSEATQLRISAFTCATRLIMLFVTEPFIPAQAGGSGSTPNPPVQTYYPRAYWKGLGYACLTLLKLSLTKTIPELEIVQSEIAIQQAVELLSACSTVEGDELHRMARLIRFLRQEAVQEIVKPRHQVKSRMGASLMYEMILSAVALKKTKAREQSEDERSRPQKEDEIENASPMNTASSIAGMSLQEIDELIASSGCPTDWIGPMGLDTNFWDTPMFDQVSLEADTTFSF